MQREAVFVVVGLVVAVPLVALAVRDARLRARVHRLERTVAAVQDWAEQQLRAIRSDLTALEQPRDTLTTPEPAMTAPKPSDEDGDPTLFLDANPLRFAPRLTTLHPPAPLADPDLIGSDDMTKEAAHLPLGPHDKTPPRPGRAAALFSAFRGSEEGGSA